MSVSVCVCECARAERPKTLQATRGLIQRDERKIAGTESQGSQAAHQPPRVRMRDTNPQRGLTRTFYLYVCISLTWFIQTVEDELHTETFLVISLRNATRDTPLAAP